MAFLFFILFCVFLSLFFVYKDKDKIKTRRIDKIKKGLDDLYQNKRINADEYQQMMGCSPEQQAGKKPTPVVHQKQVQPQPTQAAQSMQTQSELAVDSAKSVTHSDNIPVSIDDKAPSLQTPKEKKKFSGLNALMVAGVIFILLSGAIFVTTTWGILPSFVRLIVMCSFSVLFFSASVLADKSLGIRKTSVAFYTIASVFLPITVIAAGFFKLFGEYLSTSGEGNFLLYMIASIVLGAPCFIGAKKFKLAYFSEAFLYCISLTYVFLILSFNTTADIFILWMLLYAAAWVILGNVIFKKSGMAESIILSRIPLFSMINALAITIIGAIVIDMGWGGLMLLAFSPLFLTALFNKKSVYWGTLPFAFSLVLGFGRLYTGDTFINYIWMQIIVVAILSILSGAPVFCKKRRIWLSTIVFVISGLVFLVQFLNLLYHSSWTFSHLMVVVALLLSFIFLAYRNKEKYIKYTFPILTVTVISGVADMLQNDSISLGLIYVLLASLAFAVVMILDKIIKWSPRTSLYDILLTSWCAIGVLIIGVTSVRSNLTELIIITASFSVLLGMLTVLAIEKKPERSSIAVALIPFVFYVGSIPVYEYFNRTMNAQWVFVIYFAILAGASLWAYPLRKKSKVIEAFGISCFVFLWLAGAVTASSLSGEPRAVIFLPASALIWSAFLFCRIIQMAKENYINSRKRTYFIFSLWFVISLFFTSMVTAHHWFKVEGLFWILLFPTCLALLLHALLPAFKVAGKTMPKVFCFMPRIASWSLSFFAALILIFYSRIDSTALISIVYGVIVLSLLSQYHIRRAYVFAWFDLFLLSVTSVVLLNQLSDRFDLQWLGILIFGVQFFVFAGAGRLLHKYVIDLKKPSSERLGKSIDWLTLSSVFSPMVLLFLGTYALWSAFILFCVYALTFVNRTKSRSGNQVAMTFAGFFVMFIFWFQPYLDVPERVITEYNLIVFILYFIYLNRLIWKGKVSALLLYLSVCISFFVLAIAAMQSGSIIDSLIIGGSAATMIVVSFILKRKRWFTLSFVVLLFLGFYVTQGLWSSIMWWLYLLFVGFLLIGLAAANEVSKQKGEGLGKKAGRYFDKWK